MKRCSRILDNHIARLAVTFLLFVVLFQLQRLCFAVYYHGMFSGVSSGEIFRAFIHGLPLDMSVAGYLSIVPGLLLIAAVFCGYSNRILRAVSGVYFAILSLVLASIFVSDLALYDFWGFRIDFTPVFYFISSPEDAIASVSTGFVMLGVLAMLICAGLNFLIFYFCLMRKSCAEQGIRRKIICSTVLLLLTAALFIPIRGGLNPTTMNLSEAYFSQNARLNHTAINPVFSLMYSMSHQSNFDEQYRFMDDASAQRLFDGMTDSPVTDNIPAILKEEFRITENSSGGKSVRRPDVVMVILESFSTHLMKSLGGEDIARNLDSIASDGLLFTNFYANSFRTDRATPAIISGYPSQPSTSIMKYAEKIENIPSIPRTLKENGYDIAFYYGGDANFTNLMAYLVSCGFEKVISEKDFPVSQRTGKWGVNDMALFDRFAGEYLSEKTDRPRFRIVQTSSSHDPFDVPDYNVLPDIRANSFSYTDMCIGKLVETLKGSPVWDNTLMVFVPDHWAAYPDADRLTIPQRHSIPLVLSGGALSMKGRNDTYSSQIDIAATLLYQLGIDHSGFVFSKNILNPDSPHFAYFTEPSLFGMITPDNTLIFNCDAGQVMTDEGTCKGANLEKGKAFLQKLYDNMEVL